MNNIDIKKFNNAVDQSNNIAALGFNPKNFFNSLSNLNRLVPELTLNSSRGLIVDQKIASLLVARKDFIYTNDLALNQSVGNLAVVLFKVLGAESNAYQTLKNLQLMPIRNFIAELDSLTEDATRKKRKKMSIR